MIRRWVGGVVWLALVGSAFAKNISITTTPRAELQGDKLVATVRVGNSGDEAALSVAPILRFRDQTVRGKGQPQLAPNGSFEESLSIGVGSLPDGRHPFGLAIDYTDANQYPFQALQVLLLTKGDVPPAKVAVPEISADPIAGSGDVTMKVKNLSATARSISLGLHVPEGLEVATPRRELQVDAWGEQSVTIEIVNRAALPGSRYPVFVTAEYDEDGKHQAIVTQNVVEIVPGETFFERNARTLMLAAGALVVAWILAVIMRGVRR